MDFFDKELGDEISEEGYATVQCLRPEEVEAATALLSGLDIVKKGEGFQNIMNLPDFNKRAEISQLIIDIVQPRLTGFFENYVPFVGSFAVKHKSNYNNVPLHLDWSVVDENKYRSFNVWVPLVDVNNENGCMGVLAKSHKRQHNVRGSLINRIAVFEKDEPIINSYKENHIAKMLDMNAGQALIYDHRLAHFSCPNKTDKPRLAVSVVMVPSTSPLFQYHFESDGSISVFALTREFYLTYDMQSHPGKYLEQVGTIPSSKALRCEDQLNPLVYI